jgi:hypothetical protein
MSAYADRFDLGPVIGDHQNRIRTLEALVATGGGDSDCLNCDVLIPGGVPVPDELRACVDARGSYAAGGGEFNPNNGLLQGPYGPTLFVGKGGNVDLVPSVRLQAIVYAYTGPGLYAGAGQLEIELMFDAAPGAIKTFSFPDLISQPTNPDTGLHDWSSGWVNWFDAIGSGSCADLTANILIAQNAVVGGANCGWSWGLRWVITRGGTVYRGALDDLPQGESQDDVLHFNSNTHEWVVGPGDSPSRAFSSFMGG